MAELLLMDSYKAALPAVCWTFSDGPFRDSCIRYGYDPRQHREARMYVLRLVAL